IRHLDPLDGRRPGVAEVVPYEIEAAERVGGFAHDPPCVCILAQIGDDALGLAAGRNDFLDHGRDPGTVDIDDPDAGSLARKTNGAGATHSGAGCGHDADFILESHGVVLPARWFNLFRAYIVGASPGEASSPRRSDCHLRYLPVKVGGSGERSALMHRRAFLKTMAGAGSIDAADGLAAPAVSQRVAARALSFVPQADLSNFDPVWSSTIVVRNASIMVWDMLYGIDEKLP